MEEFNKEIEEAYRAAWQSTKGGDDNWNSFLNTYGIEPMTKSDKEMLLNSEIKIARGAFPVELRKVYQKIIEKHSSDSSAQQTISSFDMDGKIKDYYQKIKPFSGMSDIFKNATGTINKYSTGLKGEKQYTIRCKNCAAPRLDTMQYDACLFCGSKLFEPIT